MDDQGQEQNQKPSEQENKLHTLRTFKSDSADYIKNKNVSKMDVIIANAKKSSPSGISNEDTEQKSKLKKIIFIILATIIVIGVGVGGLFFLKPSEPQTQTLSLPKPVLVADEEIEITVDKASDIKTYFLSRNKFLYVAITKEENGTKKLLTLSEFFGGLNISSFFGFNYVFGENFMFGAFNSGQNHPFLILNINSYENAFAGMISWEENIVKDLSGIFGIDSQNFGHIFSDKEIQNHDTRVLIDQNNNTVLVYSFITKDYLVIASDEGSFREILRRFSLSQYLNK